MLHRFAIAAVALIAWGLFTVSIVAIAPPAKDQSRIPQTFMDCTTDGDCEAKAREFCSSVFGG